MVRFTSAFLQNELRDLADFIRSCLGSQLEAETRNNSSGCGIVYCRTREETETLAEGLTKLRIVCRAYHAGLKDKDRSAVQEMWMDGKVPVITATVSFGMGVDKASVRFVAHWSVPQSVAAYYQESGRAGRDGQQAWARVYYSRHDMDIVTFLLNKEKGSAKTEQGKKKKEAGLKSFQLMVKYCEGVGCRHAVFSRFFGDSLPQCGTRCDVCKHKKAVEAKVDKFKQCLDSRWKYKTGPLTVAGDDNDLYGGGRGGAKRDWGGGEEEGGDGGRGREKKAKSDLENVIKKQFGLRRGEARGEDELGTKMNVIFSRVRAAEFTTGKIAGLDVKTREDYLGLIENSIVKNYELMGDGSLGTKDFLDAAVDAEYEVFTNNKVVTMYRKKAATLIHGIKSCTKRSELSPLLIDFKPKPAESPPAGPSNDLTSLAKTLSKEIKSKKKVENSESSESKIRTKGGGGFRLKRETSHQKSIANYFPVKSSVLMIGGCEENNDEIPKENDQNSKIEDCDDKKTICDDTDDEEKEEEDDSSDNCTLSPADTPAEDNPKRSVHPMSESEEEEVEEEDDEEDVGKHNRGSKLPELEEENIIAERSSSNERTENVDLVRKIQQKIHEMKKSQTESAISDQPGTSSREEIKSKKSSVEKFETVAKPTVVEKVMANKKAHMSPAEIEKRQKLKVADYLVKILVPYLKTERISDKQSFKILAREFTHLVIKYQIQSNKIEKLVDRFFSKLKKGVAENEAKHLVRKFSASLQ